MKRVAWTEAKIARVKGAKLAGFSAKVIAAHSGVPIATLHHWICGKVHKEIPAERFPVELLREWFGR